MGRRLVSLAVLVTAAAACSLTVLQGTGSNARAPRTAIRQGVAHDVHVGTGPYDLAAGFGSVWVAAAHGLIRLEPRSGRVTRIPIANDGEWTNVSVGAGAVWYLESPGTIVRIDPHHAAANARRDFGTRDGREAFEGLAVSPAGVCAGELTAASGTGATICFDRHLRHERRLDAGPGPIAALATGRMWVGGHSLRLVDPASGSVTPVPLPAHAFVPAIASAGDSAWAAVDIDPTARAQLWHLGAHGVTSKQPLPVRFVSAMTVDAQGRIWAIARGRTRRRTAVYLLRRDGTVARIARVHPLARGLAPGGAALWTANYRAGTVTRISGYLAERAVG